MQVSFPQISGSTSVDSLFGASVLYVFLVPQDELDRFMRQANETDSGFYATLVYGGFTAKKDTSVIFFDSSKRCRKAALGLGKMSGEFTNAYIEEVSANLYKDILLKTEHRILIDGSFLPDTCHHVCIEHSILGLKLASYKFDRYKNAKEDEDNVCTVRKRLDELLFVHFSNPSSQDNLDSNISRNSRNTHDNVEYFEKLSKSAMNKALCVSWARDLTNEPGNVLYPESFVQSLEILKDLGIEIQILTMKDAQDLSMGAFLGVAQGSRRPGFVAILRWRGASGSGCTSSAKTDANPESAQPIVLVGKGVCFDAGGLCLKTSSNMEGMKGDMGGAAAVVGALRLVALSSLDTHVVGLVGLVENMPGGGAQRPGDIVRSMSGKTIEVLNTDAEGRLVLADLVTYAERTLYPSTIVTIGTVTGSIIVALGHEYAGLFTECDELAKVLIESGLEENEKLWRMPLGSAYRKMLDSKVADIQNISGKPGAGASTAAAFIQAFVPSKIRWAHLDIAGTAFGVQETALCPSWSSGLGVRLLTSFVRREKF